MSHFTVLVIGENPEQLLAPFQENNMGDCPKEYLKFNEDKDCDIDEETGTRGYWENPNAKWDWWVVGGRWANMLILKNGLKSDSARKSEIDFGAMRSAYRVEAEVEWSVAMSVISNLPENETWESVRERFSAIDDARDFYNSQPRVKAFKESAAVRDTIGFFANVDSFLTTKEKYLQDAENKACTTHAVLKDGIWYEKGNMGWFGISNDKMTQQEWNEQFAKLINELPDNSLLTVVDCHI